MDVEQRQRVRDHVVLRPLPRRRERVEVRGDGPPGQHRALGRAGRARRVDDERRRLSSGSGGTELPRASSSTSARGSVATPSGRSAPGALRTSSGALSDTMWASSRSPDLGLMGTAGTPASRAPITPTQVSGAGDAHTATRSAPSTRAATAAAASRSERYESVRSPNRMAGLSLGSESAGNSTSRERAARPRRARAASPTPRRAGGTSSRSPAPTCSRSGGHVLERGLDARGATSSARLDRRVGRGRARRG